MDIPTLQPNLLDLLDAADEQEQEIVTPPFRAFDPISYIAFLLPEEPLQKEFCKTPEQYLTDLVVAFLHPQAVKGDDPLFSLAVEKTLQDLHISSPLEDSWEEALQVAADNYAQWVEEARGKIFLLPHEAIKGAAPPAYAHLFQAEDFFPIPASVHIAATEIVTILEDVAPRFPFMLPRLEELFPLFTLRGGMHLLEDEKKEELQKVIADNQVPTEQAVKFLLLQLGKVSGSLEEKLALIGNYEALQHARREAGKNIAHLSLPPPRKRMYYKLAQEIKQELFVNTGRAVHFPLPNTLVQYKKFLHHLAREALEEYWTVEDRELISGDAAVVVQGSMDYPAGTVGIVNLERNHLSVSYFTEKDECEFLITLLKYLQLKPLTRTSIRLQLQKGDLVEIVNQTKTFHGSRGFVSDTKNKEKQVRVYIAFQDNQKNILMQDIVGYHQMLDADVQPFQQHEKPLPKEVGDKVYLSPKSRFAQQNIGEGEVIALSSHEWELPYLVRFTDGMENIYDAEDLEFVVLPERIAERRKEAQRPRKISKENLKKNLKKIIKKVEQPLLREYQHQCRGVIAQEYQKLKELGIPESVILAIFTVHYPDYQEFFPKGENAFAQINALRVPELQERVQFLHDSLYGVLKKEKEIESPLDFVFPEIENEEAYLTFLRQPEKHAKGYRIVEKELLQGMRVVITDEIYKNKQGNYHEPCNAERCHVFVDGNAKYEHINTAAVKPIELVEFHPTYLAAVRQATKKILQQEKEREHQTTQHMKLAQEITFYLSALGYSSEKIKAFFSTDILAREEQH